MQRRAGKINVYFHGLAHGYPALTSSSDIALARDHILRNYDSLHS